jgi:hypothetical protein
MFLIKYQLGVDYQELLEHGKEVSNFQRQYNFHNQEAHLAICLKAVQLMIADPNHWIEDLQEFNMEEEAYYLNALSEKNAVLFGRLLWD